MALIMVVRRGDAAGLARALDAEGLTVVGCSASVTSAAAVTGAWHRVVIEPLSSWPEPSAQAARLNSACPIPREEHT